MAKQFSDIEKRLLYSIYENGDSHTYPLTNLFSQWLYKPGVRFDLHTGNLIFDRDRYGIDEELTIRKEIIRIALLIIYLEENGYIYIIKDPNAQPLPFIGDQNDFLQQVTVFLPNDIAQVIRRSQFNILASYDFIQFVENDFRTYEDKQLSQAAASLCWAKLQTFVAILAVLVSVVMLMISINWRKADNHMQVQKNEKLINAVVGLENNLIGINNKNTLELSAHIDSLGVSFTQHNTKNVNVTKTSPKRTCVKKQYNLIQIDTINCDGKQYIVLPIAK